MTIFYEGAGDIFRTHRQTLVCPVNAVGVMGNGLALAFKLRCPGLFEAYQEKYRRGGGTVKDLFLYTAPSGRQVLCFPTKDFWKDPSKVEYLTDNLKTLVESYKELGITSMAFPPIGCGQGGMDYHYAVKPLLHEYLGPLDIEVDILFHDHRA